MAFTTSTQAWQTWRETQKEGVVKFRLNPAERKHLKQCADLYSGGNVSSLLRYLILEAAPKLKGEIPLGDQELRLNP